MAKTLKIKLTGLRVFAHHGVFDFERQNALEREGELMNDMEVLRTQALVYKEDFDEERRERTELALGKAGQWAGGGSVYQLRLFGRLGLVQRGADGLLVKIHPEPGAFVGRSQRQFGVGRRPRRVSWSGV